MKIWEKSLIIFVFIIAIFLRFYNLESTQPFLLDETRDAYIVRAIIKDHIFPLTGPTTSIGQIQLGPAYYYLMVPWLWFFNLDPLGMTSGNAFLGVITVGLLFWLGRDMIGEKGALIATILYATNAFVVNNTRTAWNPNPIPLFALLTLWSLYQVYHHNRLNYGMLAFGSWALAIQFHYTAWLLLPVILWVLYRVWQVTKDRTCLTNNIGKGIGIGLLIVSPLMWYERTHDFPNVSKLMNLLGDGKTIIVNPWFLLSQYWNRLTYQVGYLLNVPFAAFGHLSALISVGFLIQRSWLGPKAKIAQLSLITLGLSSLGLSLIKDHPMSPHYVAFLFPMIFLVVGWILSQLTSSENPTSWFGWLILLVLILSQYPHYSFQHPVTRTMSDYRRIANQIEEDAKETAFNLYVLNESGEYLGLAYRYFIELGPGQIRSGANYQNLTRLYVIDELSKQPFDPQQAQAYINILGIPAQLPGTITKQWENQGTIVYRLEP